MSSKQRQLAQQGQALLEFALIITVLLMMIFLIIESARILWAWNTVQNAAREGARYAVTGQFTDPCDSADMPKFADLCNSTDQEDRRVASIINATHKGLSGLPLDETTGTFEDDNYYQIEVFGVNESNQFLPWYGGRPSKPVIVRAYYRVPIITPLLQPIISSVPVFGQVTMTNESFGQLGGSDQGEGVPPELPLIPTAGVTPSPLPTDTPGPTATPSETPTATPSPTPDYCGVAFDSPPIAGNDFVDITGEFQDIDGNPIDVTIIDQTTGATLGVGRFLARNDHACPGFVRVTLSQQLIVDHLIVADTVAVLNDLTDTAFVLPAPPTETPTFTPSPAPTATPSSTPTITPSPTPGNPYIVLLPNCGSAPNIQFTVQGFNWSTNEDISLYWDSDQLQSTINTGASTAFSQNWTINGVVNGTDYEVVAISPNDTASATFSVPCPVPPTATPITATPTNTPEPADLIVVGPPELISTPPIVAYEPVDFRVVISNTGGIDIESQFFVDIYLDPSIVLTTTIPITQSGGYQGVGSLAGGASRVITITAPLGFGNAPEDHLVYGMVDSIEQIEEDIETNNISTPFPYNQVTPAATPTPTPVPELGENNIIGVVYYPTNKGLSPLLRANVTLVNADTSEVVKTTTTDPFTGFYIFTDLAIGSPPINYNVLACGSLITDEGAIEYFGLRTGITLPYDFPVNIYTDNSSPCP